MQLEVERGLVMISIIIYKIFCTGNESKWSNYSYTIETNDLVCGDIQDAHVVCHGMELLEISMMYIHVCMYHRVGRLYK